MVSIIKMLVCTRLNNSKLNRAVHSDTMFAKILMTLLTNMPVNLTGNIKVSRNNQARVAHGVH